MKWGREHSAVLVMLGGIAWIGNAVYALGASGSWIKYLSPAIVAVALSLFFILHCERRYGRGCLLPFLVVVFGVGWVFESLSMATGVPFGRYYYTDIMAPFLGQVPVFVLPAYLLMAYAAWSLATLFLGIRTAKLPQNAVFRVPILAAGLMTLWDLSMDPLRATVEGRWIWIDGGAYLGVPITNFLGWFIATWCMFQLFALFLHRFPRPDPQGLARDRHYWAAIPVGYTCWAGEYLINPLTGHGVAQMPVGSTTFGVQEIFTSVAIVTCVTLLPLLLVGLGLAYGKPARTPRGVTPQPVTERCRAERQGG